MTHSPAPAWTPAPRQGLVPLYPFGFGTILGRSFSVLKGNPGVLLGFVVGVQLVAMIVFTVAIGGITFAAFSRAETVPEGSAEFAQLMAGGTAIVLISSLLLSLLLVAVTTIAQGVVIAEVGHAALSEKAPLGRLWARVRPAFWRLVGYSLLLSLMTVVGMAVLVVPLVVLALVNTTASWIAFVLGIFAAFLAGLVLYAWIGTKLYLAPSAIVLEGIGPLRAIARSWRLTRGRFWSTFGVVAILFVITQVASTVISGIFSLFLPIIGGIFLPFGSGSSAEVAGTAGGVAIIVLVVTTLLTFAIAVIMMIVMAAGGTLCYIDARMRDEGIDLRMRQYVERGPASGDPYTYVPDAQPSPYQAAPQYAQPQAPGGVYAPYAPSGHPYAPPAQPPAAPAQPVAPPPAAPQQPRPPQDPSERQSPPAPPAPPV